MGLQRFYADPRETFEWLNGAKGYRSTSNPSDCLGPYAKVENCPIHGTRLRRTCYATSQADTAFSIPAVCKVDGYTIKGYFGSGDPGLEFHVMDSHKQFLQKHFDTEAARTTVEKGI